MRNNITHPIAKHSQQRVQQAFWKLMQYKKFEEITITEIAKKAQIDRRTFYRNFHSKQDIIDLTVITLLEDYLKQYQKLNNKSIFNIIQLHYEFWQNHFEILQALNNNNMLQIILKHYEKIIPMLKIHPEHIFPNEYQYFYRYNIAGCWYLLVSWVDEHGEITPKEMAEHTIHILHPALR